MHVRCLIVDDNASFREEMRALLTEQGLEVVGGAGSPTEALRQIAELRPDVALIDIDLGHQSEPVALAASECLERIVATPRRNELLNQSGVDDRTAAADSSHGLEELVDIGDATLEHVAGAAAAREQRHRVLHLNVCGEDQ